MANFVLYFLNYFLILRSIGGHVVLTFIESITTTYYSPGCLGFLCAILEEITMFCPEDQ